MGNKSRRIKKVLITGALGGIVGDIISALKDRYELRLSDYRKPERTLGHEFVKADVRNYRECERAVKSCDAVVHLAAKGARNPYTIEPLEAVTVNSVGTLNLFETGVENKIKKLVSASSLSIYGCRLPEDLPPAYFPIDEKHPLRPKTGYGLSKILAEKICRWYAQKYNLPVIALRIGTVFTSSYPRRNSFLKPEEEVARRYHSNLWNHVDGRDVGQVVKLSLESNFSGFEAFNITAEDHLLTIPSMELIQRFCPGVERIYNKDGFVTEGNKSFYDISKARRLLGYHPEYNFKKYFDWIKGGKAEIDYYGRE